MNFGEMVLAAQELTGLPFHRTIRLVTVNILLVSQDLYMAAGIDEIPAEVADQVMQAITDASVDHAVNRLLAY